MSALISKFRENSIQETIKSRTVYTEYQMATNHESELVMTGSRSHETSGVLTESSADVFRHGFPHDNRITLNSNCSGV